MREAQEKAPLVVPAEQVLPIVSAVIRCDWLDANERCDIAQDLLAAADAAACDALLTQWELAFTDGRLIDLTGEFSA